jgi:hypothetical protein
LQAMANGCMRKLTPSFQRTVFGAG